MKLNKILVIIILLVCVSLGWYSELYGKKEEVDYYSIYKQEAKEFEEKGLIYDAYMVYKNKIMDKYSNTESYQKMMEYTKALKKNTELENYAKEAIKKFPDNLEVHKKLLDYYFERNDYYLTDFAKTVKRKFPDYQDERLNQLNLQVASRALFVHHIYDYVGEYAVYVSDGLYGVMDANTSDVISSEFEFIGSYSEETQFFPVKFKNEFFYADINGYKRKANTENYELLGTQRENRAYAKKDGKYGFIDFDMQKVSEFDYEDASTFKNNIAFVKKNNKWKMINENLESLNNLLFDEIRFDDAKIANQFGVFFARNNQEWSLFNEKGEKLNRVPLLDVKKFESNDLAAVKIDKGWTFIDKEGKLSDKIFEETNSFNYKKTTVKKDGKYYLIDNQFNFGKELTYQTMTSFNKAGYAKVSDSDGRISYVSTYIEKEE